MNALPWANIDAAFTHNAFALINVNELLWLYSLCKVIGGLASVFVMGISPYAPMVGRSLR
jgi:hypothetical protein